MNSIFTKRYNMTTNPKEKVEKYYDQEASDYIHMYEPGYVMYPANSIRLNIVTKRLLKNKTKKILDAGCGTCGPMIRFLKEGFVCKGFDFSKEMVDVGKKELERVGYDPSLIFVADIENNKNLPDEKFDAITALGVFPHIVDEKKTLLNMKHMLNNNGKVYIEFRNDLFSTFTLNKYSMDFFLNRIIDLSSLPLSLRDDVVNFYQKKFNADKKVTKDNGKLQYTDILAKFKNPFTIEKELFEPCDIKVDDIMFYHYHVLPPIFEEKDPKLFNELSLKMENPHDWKGYFLASAFVIEATKID